MAKVAYGELVAISRGGATEAAGEFWDSIKARGPILFLYIREHWVTFFPDRWVSSELRPSSKARQNREDPGPG